MNHSATHAPRGQLGIFWTLVACACLATVYLRLYPIEWGFTPVGALCLFLGARLRSWWALLLPVGLMLLSDFLIAQAKPDFTFWHHVTPYVYGSLALMFVLGRFVVGSSENPGRILGAAIAGGVPFFLITNFGSWYTVAIAQTVTPLPGIDDYSADLVGLLTCYWRALPWHRGIFAGDVIFSCGLFGAYALATRWLSSSEATGEVTP